MLNLGEIVARTERRRTTDIGIAGGEIAWKLYGKSGGEHLKVDIFPF